MDAIKCQLKLSLKKKKKKKSVFTVQNNTFLSKGLNQGSKEHAYICQNMCAPSSQTFPSPAMSLRTAVMKAEKQAHEINKQSVAATQMGSSNFANTDLLFYFRIQVKPRLPLLPLIAQTIFLPDMTPHTEHNIFYPHSASVDFTQKPHVGWQDTCSHCLMICAIAFVFAVIQHNKAGNQTIKAVERHLQYIHPY